jgi:hypothetical protein
MSSLGLAAKSSSPKRLDRCGKSETARAASGVRRAVVGKAVYNGAAEPLESGMPGAERLE